MVCRAFMIITNTCLADWVKGEGEPNGFKLVTAFFPEEQSNSNGN